MTDNKTEIFNENAVLVGLITMSQNEKKAKEYGLAQRPESPRLPEYDQWSQKT